MMNLNLHNSILLCSGSQVLIPKSSNLIIVTIPVSLRLTGREMQSEMRNGKIIHGLVLEIHPITRSL